MDPTSAPSDDGTVDVVIVGAGPIGLATACALAHHGVRFRILERAHGISGESKGHNVIARAQELLHAIGVLDALAEKGYRAPLTQFLLDQAPLARLDTSTSPSPFGPVLFSNQGVMEQVLTDVLKGRGIEVEHGQEVVDVVPGDDHVSLVVASVDRDGARTGRERRLTCRYLVGADGTAGTVRKAIGLDYELQRFEGRALRQIDGRLSWRRPTTPDTAWFFLFPHGFAGILPVWEGDHRVFLLESGDAVPRRDPTREEMVARAREVTGDDTLDIQDPTWFSYGEFSHGVAPGYARGRVFLVGDAGHRTLPIGGQGMNAGFLDATGVAWRLAMTIAGVAGTAVLGSYDGERHGAHAALGRQQVRGFEQLMRRNALADQVIGKLAGVVPGIGNYVFGGSDLGELEVAYHDSELSEDRFSRLNLTRRGAARAGDRAPDARIVTAAGDTATLFDVVYNPGGHSWGWRLLLLDGGDAGSHAALDDAADLVATIEWVHPLLVIADVATATGSMRFEAISDLDGTVHEAFGMAACAAIVLIRPDGHIAFRAPSDAGEALKAYVDRVVGSSPN
jgi:2-polyprenyl-6-methoxyphenol hydroxylase-like FAD-dependent oxidoreductase